MFVNKTEPIQIKIKNDYEKERFLYQVILLHKGFFMLLNVKRFMYVLRAKIYCNTGHLWLGIKKYIHVKGLCWIIL